jgi:hypothetical protein
VVLGEEEIFDPDALGLLTFLAGLVVDRLAARKLKPAPALRLPEVLKKPEPAGMWISDDVVEVEDLPPVAAVDSTAAPPPDPSAPAPHFQEALSPEPEPTLQMEEALEAPASARRLAGPLSQTHGDERREEARRFARLLISEIKLYNERAVVEGREQHNLYQRLKDDIERSRQMYDERIPADVRSSSNFFHEELVRILADGRSDALGM